jgi:hypothetical protein
LRDDWGYPEPQARREPNFLPVEVLGAFTNTKSHFFMTQNVFVVPITQKLAFVWHKFVKLGWSGPNGADQICVDQTQMETRRA